MSVKRIPRALARRAKNYAKKAITIPGTVSSRARSNLSHRSATLSKLATGATLSTLRDGSTAPKLPDGKFYAMLTIHNWEKFDAQSFTLKQKGRVVFGNKIESPQSGFPLEYRNFVVSSSNPDDFELSIDTPYDLFFSKGLNPTRQQIDYDRKFKVRQHGDLFYSIRGNSKNPKKIILTFPGFGTSTGRVAWALSYMKELTQEDLAEALIVCFQDRYGVSGTYMVTDNNGELLRTRIENALDELLDQYRLTDEDVLMFGASKGASIALMYAEKYPRARLLLSVPQMNLPYYFSKPFFINNLYLSEPHHHVKQPEDYLRNYLAEERSIDYFYADDDELSNYSIIEHVEDYPNLRKFRIAGAHAAVTRLVLPSILGIMRQFLGQGERHVTDVDELTYFDNESSVDLQIRTKSLDPKDNWFVIDTTTKTQRGITLANHSLPFVRYTPAGKGFAKGVDSPFSDAKLISIRANGDVLEGPTINFGYEGSPTPLTHSSEVLLDTQEALTYPVLQGAQLDEIRYKSTLSDPEVLRIYLGQDTTLDSGSASVLSVEKFTSAQALEVFILRFIVKMRPTTVTLVAGLHRDELSEDFLKLSPVAVEIEAE